MGITHDSAHENDGGKWERIEFVLVGGGRALLTVEKCSPKGMQHDLAFKATIPRLSTLKVKIALHRHTANE